MERSDIRGYLHRRGDTIPDFASLNPGYARYAAALRLAQAAYDGNTMNLSLARVTLEKIAAFDSPIGQLMELAKQLDGRLEKATVEECCGSLLRLQFELIEEIVSAYPELRDIGS